MLEITGDDIAALSDEDLRALVGRLCEAELRRRGFSPSAATWGGNQTAKDGGLDVRVALAPGANIGGFIPDKNTGFQVKKSDMPRAAIIDEMKPGGVLRSAIADLIKASGAYVIVSSTGSTSDSALANRRAAMAEAVEGVTDASKVALDFYDRNRMATWVRDHIGLVPWVRSRIGRSISGWHSYGSWSHVPEGADPAYLVDDEARIKTGGKDGGDGLAATDGINKIRDVLRAPGGVVRLVGLSGVGKTRFVEALFDPTVGSNSLDPSLALYTDIAESPSPQPVGVASDMIATGTRAILIIDNCPPEMHRRLSDLARSTGTTISLITIEYDIREDQPEGTDVFVLDTSSLSLIEKLVLNRRPGLSQLDARTIAKFSGGNARIALALAATVEKHETISGLNDEELFQRLFQQRHAEDPSLLFIAQACSLVYSFDGEDVSGDRADLHILGAIAGKSAVEVFEAVAELKRRDLVQARGPWRAVLPHGVANRLAATALQRIPASALDSGLVKKGTGRLLKSFSRRLGYLDRNPEAHGIVRNWLAPGGLLTPVTDLNELGRAMFANIAPVLPSAALSTLENALGEADEAVLRGCTHFVPVLRSLAYDAALFERAVDLLVKLARLSREDASDCEAAKVLDSLFGVVLSGTHAPLELRLRTADKLLRSDEPFVRHLGARALQAMCKTDGFMSPYEFEFGARSRDYGYHPKTNEDVSRWFATVLKLAEPFALSDDGAAEPVRRAIAKEFRGLWINARAADTLERISLSIGAKRFWRDGWIAVRQTRTYGAAELSPEMTERLMALEEYLRPKDLLDRIRGLVLAGSSGLELDDFDDVKNGGYEAAEARAATVIENLGRDAAVDGGTLKVVLPELMVDGHKVAGFGCGVAFATKDPLETWKAMVAQVAATEKPGIGLLCGFLEGVQKLDSALADQMLDEALHDATLSYWFPVLQARVVIDEKGLARLHAALESGAAPIRHFVSLAYGRACDVIPGSEFKRLVLVVGSKTDGSEVALEILSMRLFAQRSGRRSPEPEITEAGRSLLSSYRFHRRDNLRGTEDYKLGEIIKASLVDEEGKSTARLMCRNLLDAISRHELSAYDHQYLIAALFEVQPISLLDEMFSGNHESQRASGELIRDLRQLGKNPLGAVPDHIVMAWSDQDPGPRYPLMAAVANLFERPSTDAPEEWKPLAHGLIEKAPQPEAVLNEILNRLRPTSWSGSRATKLETRLKLLDQLDVGTLQALVNSKGNARSRLQREVEEERQRETAQDKADSGRFEY